MTKFTSERWRRDPRPGALVVLGAAAAVVFFGLVFAVAISPAFVAFDERVSAALRSMSHPLADAFFGSIVHLGDAWVMAALTLVAVVVLLVVGRRAEAWLFGLTMGLGTSAGYVAKLLVERSRPALQFARIELPDSYSFPSGHALSTFLFFALVAFLVSLEARGNRARLLTWVVCVASPVLVGLARVYLGAHWVGDVTASWILGVGLMALAVALYFMMTPAAEV